MKKIFNITFLIVSNFLFIWPFFVCFSPDSNPIMMLKQEEITSLHHSSQCNIFLQTDIQLQSHKEAHHPVKGNSNVKKRKINTSQRLKDKDLESYERFQTYFSTMTEEEIEVKAEILCCTSIDLGVEMR